MKLVQSSKFKVQSYYGFTLVELLVVIAIIAILSGLILVNLVGVRERVRDTQRKSDLDQVKKALFMYKNDFRFYPANNTDKQIKACTDEETKFWGGPFACGSMVYMKLLPNDPLLTGIYQYEQKDLGDDFCLWATLENHSDSEIAKSRLRCPTCIVGSFDLVVCGD